MKKFDAELLEELLEECRKTRERVSKYPPEKKVKLFKQAKKTICDGAKKKRK